MLNCSDSDREKMELIIMKMRRRMRRIPATIRMRMMNGFGFDTKAATKTTMRRIRTSAGMTTRREKEVMMVR